MTDIAPRIWAPPPRVCSLDARRWAAWSANASKRCNRNLNRVPPAREPRVAVVGATGAVGNQLVELLETRAFPKGELRLFAVDTETASTIEIEDAEFEVEEFSDPQDLHGFDLAFLAVPER